MRKIAITHNPYRLKTDITIDGAAPKANSRLQFGEHRLQEWIETLPQLLVEECNTKEYEMTFHGTLLDYEDVEAMAQDAAKQGINIALTHIPAKEVADKEEAISQIFSDIQAGPVAELKQPDVVKAFNLAKSKDFPVNVVATMSAGKSTLINALLRRTLMPAKNMACTATITEIRDNDSERFTAEAYDKEGKKIQDYPELTLKIMKQLNSDPNVSTIRTEGDIPFITKEDTALVLVDTPGPNNSRDPEHKIATFKMLSESSNPLVLYIMNATQFSATDDDELLKSVAERMAVGNKKSRERFIFVLNKLDEFRKGEDSVEEILSDAREYLRKYEIEDPYIYPVSARTALDIRNILKAKDQAAIPTYEYSSVQNIIKRFNNELEMHFEQYAPLTPSMREQIDTMLAEAKANKDANAEALIHCGIIPIELAIRTYVRKYAKTAKIKNIVDTFSKKLESAQSFEATKQEITKNQNKHKEILATIDHINKKLDSGASAKKFKEQIDKINYDDAIKKAAAKIVLKAQEKITAQTQATVQEKMNKREAEMACSSFSRFADNLQAELQVEFDELINKHIYQNASDLLEQYSNKLAELAEDIQVGGVNIAPFAIMNGDMSMDAQALIDGWTMTEQVKVGEEWVKNTDRKWWKPWTWFQEKGHYRDIYEDREYVDGTQLAGQFFAPIQLQLHKNKDAAVEYAKEQTRVIKREFSKKFDELDRVLQGKLKELGDCASNQKNVEKRIQETEARLAWLEDINDRTNAILDI